MNSGTTIANKIIHTNANAAYTIIDASFLDSLFSSNFLIIGLNNQAIIIPINNGLIILNILLKKLKKFLKTKKGKVTEDFKTKLNKLEKDKFNSVCYI